MRVVVCTDRIGALASADAGAALGRAFVAARPGTQVAVVPIASGGPDLALALAALGDASPVVRDPGAAHGHVHHDHVHGDEEPTGVDPHSTSVGVGRALAEALASGPERVVVDLTGLVTHDGGAGILAALGAVADVPLDAGAGALGGLTTLDLAPARARVGGTELVAVVDPSELQDMLLGLRGLTSRRGRAVHVVRLVMAMSRYLEGGGHLADALKLYDLGVRAAGDLGHLPAQAHGLVDLGRLDPADFGASGLGGSENGFIGAGKGRRRNFGRSCRSRHGLFLDGDVSGLVEFHTNGAADEMFYFIDGVAAEAIIFRRRCRFNRHGRVRLVQVRKGFGRYRRSLGSRRLSGGRPRAETKHRRNLEAVLIGAGRSQVECVQLGARRIVLWRNRRRILDFARALIQVFQIATPSPRTHVKFLSGGNIQKTILAREIDACRGLLVAAYPSRGLDVGATEAVRRRLLEQRDAGSAVLLISEDLDELLTVADRIAVLYEGRVMGILPTAEAKVETVGLLMAGADENAAARQTAREAFD